MNALIAGTLAEFYTQLQAWQAAVQSGAAAVSEAAAALGDLNGRAGGEEADCPAILRRLEQLAPSFRLSAYLDQRCKRVLRAQDATLPGTLHDAVLALRSAVQDAAAALSGMRTAAAAVSDAVLLTPPQSASQQQMQQQEHLLVSHDPGDHHQQQQQEQLLECQDGGEGEQMSTPDDGREQLSGEELVLLLEGSMSGMAKDLQWMELAAADLNLDTDAAELSSIVSLWDLQPFTDEAALAAIARCCAAASPAETHTDSAL